MTDQYDIAAFLKEWALAETNADTEKLDAILSEEFIAVGPLGFTLSKKDWLDRHSSGSLRYDSMEFSEVVERRLGDVTVVIARQESPGTYLSTPVPRTLRVTLVLVRKGAHWHLASAHMSFVAGTLGAPPIPTQRPS